MCVHWYDVKADDFKTYVDKWHKLYNKDIFITEFAPQVGVYACLLGLRGLIMCIL